MHLGWCSCVFALFIYWFFKIKLKFKINKYTYSLCSYELSTIVMLVFVTTQGIHISTLFNSLELLKH